MKNRCFGDQDLTFQIPKRYVTLDNKKILTSSELPDPKKPHVSYHYPTAPLPTNKYLFLKHISNLFKHIFATKFAGGDVD